MPGHEDMSDIHERVGKSEQEFHTLSYRVNRLEEMPPRVTDLERTVQDLNNNMLHLQQAQTETRDEMRSGFNSIKEEIKNGFKEFRASASIDKGRKMGLSRAMQIAVAATVISGAGFSGLIWWLERPSEISSMSAKCKNGTFSTSDGQGACSGHGGVEMWIN
jgi:uncharacterized iron-regulated membrane protein